MKICSLVAEILLKQNRLCISNNFKCIFRYYSIIHVFLYSLPGGLSIFNEYLGSLYCKPVLVALVNQTLILVEMGFGGYSFVWTNFDLTNPLYEMITSDLNMIYCIPYFTHWNKKSLPQQTFQLLQFHLQLCLYIQTSVLYQQFDYKTWLNSWK